MPRSRTFRNRLKRLELWKNPVRASRTGGVAFRGSRKLGPVSLTANTQKGARASVAVAKGARIAVQNGRFQFIGLWLRGPFAFNLSKSGMSASIRNRHGAMNFVRPLRSSFTFGGIQIRGPLAFASNAVFLTLALVLMTLRAIIFVIPWILLFPVAVVRDIVQLVKRKSLE